MTAPNPELTAMAAEAAKQAGLPGTIEADFRRYRTLKGTWERGADHMKVHLPHYMQDAPDAIKMEALINVIRVALGQKAIKNSEAMKAWLAENRHKWTQGASQ